MQSQMQAFEEAGDDRAIFLTCYAMMTENMLRRADACGFEDCEWVLGLTHRFADYYFDALACYNSQLSPPVWHATFDHACRRKAPVLQNLLLGINAHICYDLIFALYDTIHAEWEVLSAEERARRHRDYCRVNEVIGATLDAVQDTVVEPRSRALAIVDVTMLRLDEWAMRTLLVRWREQVWGDAIAYLSAAEEERPALREAYTRQAEARAHALQGRSGLRGMLEIF
jgi:hypothetical protein